MRVAQDEKALSSAFGEIDVVLATVGTYYRFGVPNEDMLIISTIP
jgi:hypothetical protein